MNEEGIELRGGSCLVIRHPVGVCHVGKKDQGSSEPHGLERICLLTVAFRCFTSRFEGADIFTNLSSLDKIPFFKGR